MGNAVGCVSAGVKAPKKASSYAFNPFPLFSSFHGRPRNALQSSSSSSRNKKQKRERIQVDEGSLITSEQALPAALPFHSDQTSSSIPFSRSTSVVHPSLGSKKQSFQRSSSARRRSNNDPLIIRSHQLVNQVWFLFKVHIFIAIMLIHHVFFFKKKKFFNHEWCSGAHYMLI